MRVVLDTNVLVSGLLKPYGAPGGIVRMVSAGSLELCHDARILSEYRDVLRRSKFAFRPSDVDALLEHILTRGHAVSSEPLRRRLRDPNDEMFLEAALAGSADYLITGNLSDYVGHAQQRVPLVSPAEFLERYRRLSRAHLG